MNMMAHGKIMVLSLAAMSILPVGCDNSVNDSLMTEGSLKTYQTGTESFKAATRASLSNDGHVLWSMGDSVSVFAGSDWNCRYMIDNASAGKPAGQLIQKEQSDGKSHTVLSAVIAYYPYSKDNCIVANGNGGYDLSVRIPSQQTYSANSFGNGAFPMVAVQNSQNTDNLEFKNVMGALKLQLTGVVKVQSVAIAGKNNELLCGAATVSAKFGQLPSMAIHQGGGKAVSLDCSPDGIQLDKTTPSVFVITLPAMTLTKGFDVLITDSDGQKAVLSTSREQTIQRSGMLRMPAIAVNLKPKGFNFDDYTSDVNHDGTDNDNTNTDIGIDAYVDDDCWDVWDYDSSLTEHILELFGIDSDWDSGSTDSSQSHIGTGAYGNDSSHDEPDSNSSSSDLGVDGYGEDNNWK